MKKAAFFLCLIFGVIVSGSAQEWTDSWARWSETPRFSLFLSGGTNVSGFQTQRPSRYSDRWYFDQLSGVEEWAEIRFNHKSGFAGGLALEYRLLPEIGFEFRLGFRKTPLETISDTSLSWRWRDGRSDRRSTTWVGDGSFSSAAVAVNTVLRIRIGNLFLTRLIVGPAFYFQAIEDAASAIGYGFTKTDQTANMQYIDALGVSVKTGKVRWNGLGLDLGAGIDIPFGNSLGLILEAMYFFIPGKELAWTPVPGTSDGLYFSSEFPILRNVEFTAEDAQGIMEYRRITKILFHPSYFQFAVGLRLTLGR
jgi:hypothetical protein